MGFFSWWLSCGIAFGVAMEPTLGTADIMSHVTAHFGQTLEECREESGLTRDIMEEFHHYWSDDFQVIHREFGCAIICMSHKFSLLQENVRMHHLNMDDYIRSFPDGDLLSEKMVNMVSNCEKQHDDIDDDCERVVKVSACFKAEAKRAGIAPDIAMVEAVLEQYT